MVTLKSETEAGGTTVARPIGQEMRSSLSSRILGIDWAQYFPAEMGTDGISAHLSDFAEVNRFYQIHYRSIYEISHQGELFLANEDKGESKKRYYREAGDFFAYKDAKGEVVGIFVGTLIDWSSYYFRNISIRPEYQGRGLYQAMLRKLLIVLEGHGVDRIEIDVAPSNTGHIHILNKFRFNATGLNLSERWGSILRFTKHLSEKHRDVFLEQFCHGVRPEATRPN